MVQFLTLATLNVITFSKLVDISPQIDLGLSLFTVALKFITDACVYFFFLRASKFLFSHFIKIQPNSAKSAKRWLFLIYFMILLCLFESILTIGGRLIPRYTRMIEDPRRSIFYFGLFVFSTHTYFNISKSFIFIGFYCLFRY